MNISRGMIYKKILDGFRSSKILLLYLWGIKVEKRVHNYFWDVVTVNLKSVIDLYNLEKFENYLDMGCGHIAILGIYFKKKYPLSNVTSVDIYEEFIDNAKIPSYLNTTDITFIHSNLFEKLCKKYDCRSFNPPYKPDKYKEKDKRSYKKTTYSGKDGLNISRKFLYEAPKYLDKNGRIFLGINNFFVSRESCLEMIKYSNFVIEKEHKRLFNSSTIYELRLNL